MEIANVKEVQARLLQMADTVTGILERHKLRCMIAYGTLLGAVRHQGFIPWDDDFDLWLFDEEYDRALDVLRAELPEGLLVHDKNTDPIYWKAWASVRDTGTRTHCALHPDDNAFLYQGLSLDLFRLKKMPRREVPAYLERENMEFLVRKLDSGTMERDEYLRKFNAAALRYAEVLKSLARGEGDSEEVYAFIISLHGAAPDWMLPLKKYSFEGREYQGPNNADAVLTQLYRDYMTLPPPEKRIPHYDYVDFLD